MYTKNNYIIVTRDKEAVKKSTKFPARKKKSINSLQKRTRKETEIVYIAVVQFSFTNLETAEIRNTQSSETV